MKKKNSLILLSFISIIIVAISYVLNCRCPCCAIFKCNFYNTEVISVCDFKNPRNIRSKDGPTTYVITAPMAIIQPIVSMIC